MARLQLALNVEDLEASVAFYTDLLGTAPHKRRPGYANFAVADPPLKLVLFEAPGAAQRLNHLGIEVDDHDAVAGAAARLEAAGRAVRAEDDVLCCHAVQTKAWTPDPDGGEWEVYVITDDEPEATGACATDGADPAAAGGEVCCAPSTAEPVTFGRTGG